jgi:hypothetical protein
MRRLLAFLMPLGVVLGLLGAAIATSGTYSPFALLISATAPAAIIYPCLAVWRIAWRARRGLSVYPVTRIGEIIAWLTGILVTLVVAVWLYGNPCGGRPRIAKAQADAHALVSAISIYRHETGRLPDTLAELTRRATSPDGRQIGPFIAPVPAAPTGWLPYRYERHADGTFSIHSRSVEGEVRVPGPRQVIGRGKGAPVSDSR